jgi:hypothetical protein
MEDFMRQVLVVIFTIVLCVAVSIKTVQATGMNTSSLSGTFAFNTQGSNFWKYTVGGTYIYDFIGIQSGTLTFDGTGGCSVSVEGKGYEVGFSDPTTVTIFPETGSGSCTYTVASDGAVQVDFGDGVEDWVLSADGNVLTGGKALSLAESDGVNYETGQFVGIKKGAEMPRIKFLEIYSRWDLYP